VSEVGNHNGVFNYHRNPLIKILKLAHSRGKRFIQPTKKT